MSLRLIRKILWAGVGVVALALVYLLLRPEPTVERAGAVQPSFDAVFELTDHRGEIRTQEDFAGRWMLVFFGFANCPDVCPTTLAEVAAVMDGLGPNAERVQPLFISIDPARDTPEELANFVPGFDAGIVGLTGTPGQIERTAANFHIFYEKIEEAEAPDGYTMGHSSQLFLFDRQARYAMSWSYGTPAEAILADLKERLFP